MIEKLFVLIENNTLFINGFITTGVILILVGIKNVTHKELSEMRLRQDSMRRVDELIAWGVFYIIFGILITAGAFVSFYLYLN